ncbi:MAG: hypothetical protein MR757_01325 [Proteobacteria bacterium]|nr:hypothetical protein [Pseudomonadota bacterium]MDD6546490.1 hypothetical protein [Pseudomonadota bacterium]
MPEANDRQPVLESCVRDLGLDERDTVSCLSLIRNQDSDGLQRFLSGKRKESLERAHLMERELERIDALLRRI